MSTSKNRSQQKKAANKAKAKTTPQASANAGPAIHRPGGAPVDQLARICAQRATVAKGIEQQQWFALGQYVSEFFNHQQQTQSVAQANPMPRSQTVAAG